MKFNKELLKTVSTILFKILFLIPSYIIPKDNKLLIFQNIVGKGIREETKYAYLFARKYLKDYKLVYFSSEDEKKKEYFGIKKERIGFKNAWVILRAKYIFVETTSLKKINLGSLIGRFNIILLYHGAFLKDETFIKEKFSAIEKFIAKYEYKKYKLITLPFDIPEQKAKKIFHNENVTNMSHLRNDIFFKKELFSLENLYEDMNLKSYEKVFLYAPTWRIFKGEIDPLTSDILNQIDEFLRDKRWVLFINLHPLTTNLKNYTETFTNIKDISKKIYDIQEILIYTDILITDYSSVMIDFSITEKPILFYLYDLEDYKQKRGIWFSPEKDLPGNIIKNEENLFELIRNVDQINSEEYRYEMKKFKHRFNKNVNGNSCEEMYKILKLD